MREFTVSPVLNGFVVSIGCKTVVFTSNGALETAIHDYITAPEETTERFLRHSLHSNTDVLEPEHITSIRGAGISGNPSPDTRND